MDLTLKIIPQYNHSKVGTFLFNLCAVWTEFLVKHKILYYILSCTWGVLLTLIGVLLTIIFGLLYPFGNIIDFKKYFWIYYISVKPNYWGGFEMGLMFVRDKKSTDFHINPHEFGHTFQNALFGIFTPFIISIPSAIRYWIREINSKLGKENKKSYDAIWFEDFATQGGKYIIEYLGNN